MDEVILDILKKHNVDLNADLLKDLSNVQILHNDTTSEIFDKYNILYNNSHLAYQSLDINGNIIETNSTWLKTLDYKTEEVIGKWFGDFLHPDYVEAFQKRFEQFKKEGKVEDVRFKMRKGNRDYILVSFKGCILYNPRGEFKCTYCSFVDITEETMLLNKLQESEEKYRMLVENQGEGLAITNPNEIFTFANPAAEKIFGVQSGQLKGESLYNFLDKLEIDKIQQQTSIRKKGEQSSYELKIIRPDKSEKIINVTGTAHYNKQGDFIGTFGVFRDISEYKAIENKLKESENKFKAITRSAQDAIILINNTGKIIFWNKAAEKILLYKESEVINKNLHNIIAPQKYHEDHLRGFEMFKHSGKGNAVNKTLELSAIRKDRAEIPVELSISSIKLNNEWHAVGILRDITERKENELKLIESEERLKDLSELTFEGIIIHNNGIAIDCNPSLLKLFGYTSVKEIEGIDLFKLIHKDYHDIVKNNIPKSNAEPYEIIGMKKDGSLIPLEVEARNFTKNNQTLRVTAIRDITAKKEAEKAILESENKYSSLFNSMHEGVAIHEMIYDSSGNPSDYKIIELNKAFEKQTGILKSEAKNKIASKFYKTTPAPYLDIYSKVSETREPTEFESYYPPLKKHFSISVFSPKKGMFATIFSDITERKKAEEKLKELLNLANSRQKELNELNLTKDRFFSIIAHDLRGPVNNLVGFSDLLERNYLNYNKDKLSHIISLMNVSAKKTSELLENLLIWSKSQRNKISFNPQQFICKELIQEVIDEMQHLATVKGISIESSKSKGHPVSVDKDMFKTVYRNLISNAIKFTHKGGKITLGCGSVINNMVEFFVEDTGVGINEENISKLFKIDQSVTTEGTLKEKGTGLGLILCKEFITKHGGTIKVESKINKGTKFIFTFPKA